MTGTSTATEQPAETQDSAAVLKLWISSAMRPYGNSYGFIAVLAETREEAIAKARDGITADASHAGHAAAKRYAKSLLDRLEDEMREAPSGVAIDWSPADKSPKS